MTKNKHIYIYSLLLIPTFSSCNLIESAGPTLTFALFAVLFIILVFCLYLIRKKRNNVQKGSKSVEAFNTDIINILNKLETNEEKIAALKLAAEKIENNESYSKNIAWKNSLLMTVYLHLQKIYYAEGDEDSIIDVCTKILRAHPNHALSYYNRGSLYSNRKEYKKALDDFNLAIELNPSYASAYNNRGLVYFNMKQYKEAIDDYTCALEINESAIEFYNRGDVYAEIREYEKAINDYTKYLEIDSENRFGLKDTVEATIENLENELSKNKED